MSKILFNTIDNYLVNKLMDDINSLNRWFYSQYIIDIIVDSRMDGDVKYILLNDILDIYIIMLESEFRYMDCIDQYRYYNISDFSNRSMMNMINLGITLNKHIDYTYDIIESIDITDYLNQEYSDSFRIEEYPNLKDTERIEKFKNIILLLNKFKNFIYDMFIDEKLYLYKKSLENSNIIYHNIFEKLLKRYLKQLRYIKLEKIKIKYGDHINIDCSISQIIKRVNNHISEYMRENNINIYSK